MTDGRLTAFVPGTLDDEQHAAYEAIASGPRATAASDFPLRHADGSLTGPFNALVGAGELGRSVQDVGAAIRYRGALSDRARELAILVVGAYWKADFEVYAHERVARRVGLEPAIVDALVAGREPTGLEGELAAVHRFAVEALPDGRVGDATYRQAVDALGEQTVIELVVLIGYYTLLAQLLNAFEVGVPVDPGPSGDRPYAHDG